MAYTESTAYLEFSQTSKAELFLNIVKVNMFLKYSIEGASQGSE